MSLHTLSPALPCPPSLPPSCNHPQKPLLSMREKETEKVAYLEAARTGDSVQKRNSIILYWVCYILSKLTIPRPLPEIESSEIFFSHTFANDTIRRYSISYSRCSKLVTSYYRCTTVFTATTFSENEARTIAFTTTITFRPFQVIVSTFFSDGFSYFLRD